jgi:hypothetical protein
MNYEDMTFEESVELYKSLAQEIEYCKNRITEASEKMKHLPVTETTYSEEMEPIWIDVPVYDVYGVRFLSRDYLERSYKFQSSWRCLWKNGNVTKESFSNYSVAHGGFRDYDCPDGIVQIEVTPIVQKKKIVRNHLFPKLPNLSLVDIQRLIQE